MPPRDFHSIGQNARDLAGTPLPPNLQQQLDTNKLSGEYNQLTQKTVEIGDRIDELTNAQNAYKTVMQARNQDLSQLDDTQRSELARKVEEAQRGIGRSVNLSTEVNDLNRQLAQLLDQDAKQLEQVTEVVLQRRKDISDMIKNAPDLSRIMREHQRYVNDQRVEQRVQGMSNQDLFGRVQESGAWLNPVNRQQFARANDNDQRRQIAEQLVKQEERQAQIRAETAQRNQLTHAYNANQSTATSPTPQFHQKVQNLVSRGILTPNQAAPYLNANVTPEQQRDFVERYSPITNSAYIQSRISPGATPPPGVSPIGTPPTGGGGGIGGQGGPTGPGAPLNNNQGPIDVRVVNTDTEPIPVIGGAGGPGGGGVGGGGGRGRGGLEDHEVRQLFQRQEVASLLSGLTDIATPGGPAIAGMGIAGLGSAARGMASLIPASWGVAGTGAAIGIPALAAGGASAWYQGAQQQRQYERTFGEDMSVTPGGIWESDIFQAQVSARLQHLLLGGEEIDQLTEAMANLGRTAEETAEALGPAADALDRYRALTPEQAARAAARGQQFSDIGANEALAYGATLEASTGGGFSLQALSEPAEASAAAYERLGVAGTEATGLGVANVFSAGGEQTDMMLQQSGMATEAVNLGAQIFERPTEVGGRIGAITGRNYRNLDMSNPADRATASLALPEAVSSLFPPGDLARDENGEIIIGGANMDRASLHAGFISEAVGVTLSGPDILAMVASIDQQGGIDKARGMAIETERFHEEQRQTFRDQTSGETQRIAHEEGRGKAFGGEQPYGPLTQFARGAGQFAADVTGLDFLRPQETMRTGERGSGAAEAMWREEKGGVLGAISTIPGIDPARIKVDAGGGRQVSLEEARKTPRLKKLLESGADVIQVGRGKNAERISAQALAEGANQGEFEYDQGILNFGGGLRRTGEKGGPESEVHVRFTGLAEKYFEQGDARDPNNFAGQASRAQGDQRVNAGRPAHSSYPPGFAGPGEY